MPSLLRIVAHRGEHLHTLRSCACGLLREKLRAHNRPLAAIAGFAERLAVDDDVGLHSDSHARSVRRTEHAGRGFGRRVDRRSELRLRWYRFFSLAHHVLTVGTILKTGASGLRRRPHAAHRWTQSPMGHCQGGEPQANSALHKSEFCEHRVAPLEPRGDFRFRLDEFR